MKKNQMKQIDVGKQKYSPSSSPSSSTLIDYKKPFLTIGLSMISLLGLNYLLNKNGDIKSKYEEIMLNKTFILFNQSNHGVNLFLFLEKRIDISGVC